MGAIFRLHVNQRGVQFGGLAAGAVTVTDKLPANWQFKNFDGTTTLKDGLLDCFDIYEANPADAGNKYTLEAKGSALNKDELDAAGISVKFNEGEIKNEVIFTFENLNQPYVIILKAGLTQERIEKFFTNNSDGYATGEVNTATILFKKNDKSFSATSEVQYKSAVLDKAYKVTNEKEGIITWTVDYTPFIGEKVPDGAYLEDTLSDNLFFLFNEKGDIKVDVYKLTYTAPGVAPTLGDKITDFDKDFITYNDETKTMKISIPNPNAGYRFVYNTEIIGAKKDDNVTNGVKLHLWGNESTTLVKSYKVSALAASAYANTGTRIFIDKLKLDESYLTGAKFSLYYAVSDGAGGVKPGPTYRSGVTVLPDANMTAHKLKYSLILFGLRDGTYILLETDPPNGYAYDFRDIVDGQSPTYLIKITTTQPGDKKVVEITKNGQEVIYSDTNPLKVYNIQKDGVGQLNITKDAVGVDIGASEDNFKFTITFGHADFDKVFLGKTISYLLNGTKRSTDVLTASGEVKFELADNGIIQFLELPTGTTYTIVEEGDKDHTTLVKINGVLDKDPITGNDKKPTDKNASTTFEGQIDTTETDTVEFINTRYKPYTPPNVVDPEKPIIEEPKEPVVPPEEGGGGDDGGGGEEGGGEDPYTPPDEPYIPPVRPDPPQPEEGQTLVETEDGFEVLDPLGVPLGKWTYDPEEEEWIYEEYPLSALPPTGVWGASWWIYLMPILAIGTVIFTLAFGPRRKHNN